MPDMSPGMTRPAHEQAHGAHHIAPEHIGVGLQQRDALMIPAVRRHQLLTPKLPPNVRQRTEDVLRNDSVNCPKEKFLQTLFQIRDADLVAWWNWLDQALRSKGTEDR